MGDGVNPARRPYDASGRRDRARASRAAVVDAARGLIEDQGYAGTTVAAVAARAGVSPEYIYKGFGSKAALVKAVVDVALGGDAEPVSVADRPESQAIRDETDVRAKLRGFAEGAVRRQERSAKVQLALRNGAAGDPAVAELWEQLLAERLTGMTMLARHLVESGGLRAGIEVEEVRDVLWTCIAIEVYDLLVLQRGWSTAAYEQWLVRTLVASLT